jgi:hypothetical protein
MVSVLEKKNDGEEPSRSVFSIAPSCNTTPLPGKTSITRVHNDYHLAKMCISSSPSAKNMYLFTIIWQKSVSNEANPQSSSFSV